MTQYEFLCHACNRPFSKTLTPSEYEEGAVTCPHCGSEEVEQRWFYPAEARQSA
jgi:putative FmdB family regulatory protein